MAMSPISRETNLGKVLGIGIIIVLMSISSTTQTDFSNINQTSSSLQELSATSLNSPIYIKNDSSASFGTTDWGQFHGNYTHNGNSNYPGPTKPVLLWNESVGTPTLNSIEAQDGILIASSINSNDLIALNESSGKIIVNFQNPQSSIATGEQISEGGEVYFVAYSLHAWSPGSIDLCGNTLSSGQNTWQTEIRNNVFSMGSWSPIYGYYVETYLNGIVYLAAYNSPTLSAFDSQDGMSIWNLNLNRNIATIPTGGGGVLAIGFSNNYSLAGISFGGRFLWNFTTDSLISDTPAYSNGYFYFGTSNGSFYKVSTKGQLVWKYSTDAQISTTPTIADNLVYIAEDNGITYALNDTTGNLVWRFTDNNAITSSPAISSNHILYEADSGGNLIALNSTNGQLIWQYQIGAAVYLSPVLDHGYLFVIASNGDIFAFGHGFEVDFTESGLASGTYWNISMNSENKTSNGSTIRFLVQNGTYYYKVGEVVGFSSSPSSGTVVVNGMNQSISISFSQGWSLPSAPQNLKATGSLGSIVLRWNPPESNGAPPGFSGSGIDSYYIYRSTSPGQELYYDKVNGTLLSYTDSSVNLGTVYFYEVTSMNPIGQSGFSNEASGQPLAVTIPQPPSNLIATPESDGIYLTFNAPVSDGGSGITEYIIYKGTQQSSEVVFKTLPANVTEYLDTDVTPGQVYYYFVVAVNSQGQSNPSQVSEAVASKSVPVVPFWNPNNPYFWQFMGVVGTSIIIILTLVLIMITAKKREVRKVEKEVNKIENEVQNRRP